MTGQEIKNFIINIKAASIVSSFLYDYLDEHGKLDDIKEELDEDDYDDIYVGGYTCDISVIKVLIIYPCECTDTGVMLEEFSIELDDFINYLKEN